MFDKILIANRGEIACRIVRTARRLGIATVAVYSEADADARHVRLADEAVAIGPAAARESYLNGAKIIEAARRTGAQAIHPGYGFLSENDTFAEACAAAGLVFIGPPASAIRAMGSKSAAKALMARAGVPLTPGYHGDPQDPTFLFEQACGIGWPVLVKASAGGGGKGMRRVDRPDDFLAALAACQRESKSAFDDDRVLIERYVVQPRHIEMQIFADTHGQVVHLFERDCSVQRRHQKVLEEAPAPGMTPERRTAMGRAAIDAARAVGYVGAGTVEFIVDRDGDFSFMEMNTRLQVEHPVTEMITGFDLVEWQFRVACGEPLPATQAQITLTGHALEARIYAEDPDRGFLPSTGRLMHLTMPTESASVRVDAGVAQGDTISPHYDPMIAKLIVHGADRFEALARMRHALADVRIVGVRHNVDFLARLVATPAFADADLDTGLIERHHALLFPPDDVAPPRVWLLASLAEALRERRATDTDDLSSIERQSPWRSNDGWRLNGTSTREIVLRRRDVIRKIAVRTLAQGFELKFDPDTDTDTETATVAAHGTLAVDGDLQVVIDGHRQRAFDIAHDESRHLFFEGRHWTFDIIDPLHTDKRNQAASNADLRAPMPGTIIALLVAPGTPVDVGAPLLVMEAMKMEHTIYAPRPGTVRAFRFAAGTQVDDGAELVEFDAS